MSCIFATLIFDLMTYKKIYVLFFYILFSILPVKGIMPYPIQGIMAEIIFRKITSDFLYVN